MGFYFPELAHQGLLNSRSREPVAIAMMESYDSSAWRSNPNGGGIYAQSKDCGARRPPLLFPSTQTEKEVLGYMESGIMPILG